MALRSGLLAILAPLTLAGCQFEASIEVVPNGGRPDFVITYDQGKAACVKGLTVTALAGDQRTDVWAIRRRDGAAEAVCKGRFTYGLAPSGYEAVIEARPLRIASPYEVSATGTGWSASTPLSIR